MVRTQEVLADSMVFYSFSSVLVPTKSKYYFSSHKNQDNKTCAIWLYCRTSINLC